MNDHPLARLIDLVSFDQKLQRFENEKIKIENQIAALKYQIESLLADKDEMNKNVMLCKKRVDEQELEMKDLDQKEKIKKQQFENLSDYKEYQAIKAEIESIHHLQIQQEQKVLEAWNQLESAQNVLQKKEHEVMEKLESLHKEIKELGQKAIDLQEECAALILQREEKKSGIPSEWLEKYVIMGSRVPDPIVEVTHQSCSACSQVITTQEMVRIQRGALIQCQTCFRLLYAPEHIHNISE